MGKIRKFRISKSILQRRHQEAHRFIERHLFYLIKTSERCRIKNITRQAITGIRWMRDNPSGLQNLHGLLNHLRIYGLKIQRNGFHEGSAKITFHNKNSMIEALTK